VTQALPTIAILGGTGDLGSGLAKRWVAAGYPIIIGSRSREKAEAAAKELAGPANASARGEDNLHAAQAGEIVVIAVPWGNHEATLQEIKAAVAGKIVVDAAVPLVPPKVATVQLPPEGSAAQAAQRILGPEVKVVSAFQNVGAAKLQAGGSIDCDVLVCGNDKVARETVIALADAAGTRGIDGGVLANSAAADALTSLLIGINRRYKAEHAGIRITGLPTSDAG
jgi:8-hydroxy-5-deazaflavin:NADPH oxidoreductase